MTKERSNAVDSRVDSTCTRKYSDIFPSEEIESPINGMEAVRACLESLHNKNKNGSEGQFSFLKFKVL